MPVSDLARADVVSVDPSTPVTEIASTMARTDVGSVLVTADGQAVGIVTDRDAKHTNHITLSYTFYEIDLPEETQAALDAKKDAEASVN